MSDVAAEPKRWNRRDALALVAAGLVGCLIAISPHLAMLATRGTLDFVAEDDDALYLCVARAPYYGENALRDPFAGRWEHVPSLYAWLNFVPLAKLTRALGLPFLMMGFVWRTVGGTLLGVSLYVLLRRLFQPTRHPTAWALGCALICLADGGFLGGRSLIQNTYLIKHLIAGTVPLAKPDAIPQYRVVTPLLNLPFVLFLIASLLPAGRRYVRDGVLGAVMLGVCFWIYFFFWTGSVAGLGLMAAALLAGAWMAPERRSVLLREFGLIVAVILGGFLIGLPQFYNNFKALQIAEYRPILERLAKPIHLAPGEPTRFWYLRNFWLLAKVAIGCIALIRWHIPGLRLLLCFTLAGFLLANSAIITGLEFENFHWSFVYAPASEIMLLAVGVWVCEHLAAQRPAVLNLLWLLPVSLVTIALIWRPYEALHTRTSVRFNGLLAQFRPLRASLAAIPVDASLAGPADTIAALLFTRGAALYSVPYSWMTLEPDHVLHERHALNGWLQGLDRQNYLALAAKQHNAYMFPRPQWSGSEIARERGAIFDELMRNPSAASPLLRRYRPGYLLLPATAPPPQHAGPWRLVDRTELWTLWARQTDAEQAGSATARSPAAGSKTGRGRRAAFRTAPGVRA